MNSNLISNIEKHGITARGRQELIKHLEGERLTLKQAVYAHTATKKLAVQSIMASC